MTGTGSSGLNRASRHYFQQQSALPEKSAPSGTLSPLPSMCFLGFAMPALPEESTRVEQVMHHKPETLTPFTNRPFYATNKKI